MEEKCIIKISSSGKVEYFDYNLTFHCSNVKFVPTRVPGIGNLFQRKRHIVQRIRFKEVEVVKFRTGFM